MLLTYWNTASFFTLYAEANGWDPAAHPGARRGPSARCWTAGRWPSWPRSPTAVTAALEDFDTQTAGRLLAAVRRRPVQLVRAPVPPPLPGTATRSPWAPCTRCSTASTRLMAPFRRSSPTRCGPAPSPPGLGRTRADSVHLASWPHGRRGRPGRRRWSPQMDLVRRLVELGRSARTSAKVRTRQPLARALVAAPGLGRRSPATWSRRWPTSSTCSRWSSWPARSAANWSTSA